MAKTKQPSKGILMFAHNNNEIDYFKLAITNALLIQKHMGLTAKQITIVTDTASYNYGKETLGTALIKSASTSIIINEKDPMFKKQNMRLYKDTSHRPQTLSFYNVNRADAYNISPYDETILIDCDYLVLSDALNACWGHHNDLMMNYSYKDIMFERPKEVLRLSATGVTMYWATVVYFRKTEFAESFFEIVKHVREHREYYQDMYNWKGSVFRNDYAFSVAAHMISGFKDQGLEQLPMPELYKTFDLDDIHEVNTTTGALTLFIEKINCTGEYVLTKWQGVDLHVMNKWAINRISDGLIEYAKKKERKARTTRVSKKKVAQSNTTKSKATVG